MPHRKPPRLAEGSLNDSQIGDNEGAIPGKPHFGDKDCLPNDSALQTRPSKLSRNSDTSRTPRPSRMKTRSSKVQFKDLPGIAPAVFISPKKYQNDNVEVIITTKIMKTHRTLSQRSLEQYQLD